MSHYDISEILFYWSYIITGFIEDNITQRPHSYTQMNIFQTMTIKIFIKEQRFFKFKIVNDCNVYWLGIKKISTSVDLNFD